MRQIKNKTRNSRNDMDGLLSRRYDIRGKIEQYKILVRVVGLEPTLQRNWIFLGLWFFDLLAQPVLEKLGKVEKMAEFSAKIEQYGGMAVFGAGLTPFPYKVITIMSGALKINFAVFVAASVIARFMRFFAVAGIVRLFGQQAEEIMKKHFGLFTTGVFVLLLGAWFGYKALTGH